MIENKLIESNLSKTVWSNVHFIESHLIEIPHERKPFGRMTFDQKPFDRYTPKVFKSRSNSFR
jgi:hypothetical protein